MMCMHACPRKAHLDAERVEDVLEVCGALDEVAVLHRLDQVHVLVLVLLVVAMSCDVR
jgi:hypothetical protein